MPLPTTKKSIYFIDDKGNQRQDASFKQKDTGYQASEEYHPTMRAGKCSRCGLVGVIAFRNGFNIKLGDRVMDGKTIPGTCPRCGKGTEFVPLPVDDPKNKDIGLYYNIQKSLMAHVKRGWDIGAQGDIQPVGRIIRWEEYVKRLQDAAKA